MLLGRPWQRGNFVSIDERSDGTYLLFKDPKSLDTRYEFLVTPDNMTTMDWDFEPSTWHITESPATYLIEVAGEANHDQRQIETLIKDYPVSDLIDRPYSDQATDATNFGKPRNQNIVGSLLHWLGSLTEEQDKGDDSPERKPQNAIKDGRTYKQVPCRFLDTLPEPTNMALNVATVPISSDVEDLPVIYSYAAPARSEADDLRDALQHKEFLHHQGYFSNVTLNSAQAFVTGYHADGQGNRYTAITGLRTVRTAFIGNGPQTVYGHYTARLYTDLDPVPSSVVIPTFLQPTNQGEENTYWVSRNGNPHVWTHGDRDADWVDYQPPPNPDSSGTNITEVRASTPDRELSPPTYSPTTPPQVSRSDESESTTDDENWLPCTRCAKTHGDFGCVAGSQYSLVRVSSNGSVSSSVHLLDEPIKIECYVGTKAEFHTINASSGSEGSEPIVTRTPSCIIDSCNESELLEYNTRRYPHIRKGRSPPYDPKAHKFTQSAPTSPADELPALISVSDSEETDDDDDEEMQEGVLYLWTEYKKGLTEEELERYWGMTPYHIIMGLEQDEIDRLAEAAVAAQIKTVQQQASILANVASCSPIAPIRARNRLMEVLQRPTHPPLRQEESPIELTAQEARGLASHHRIVPCQGIGMGKRRNSADSPSTIPRQSMSIPETFPFTYTSDYTDRPAECSPISVPEPMAVYAARVAKPFVADYSLYDPLRSAPSFNDEYPDTNKFRAFLKSPAVWPTVPPIAVYTSTSHAPDPRRAQTWDIGAEPMSPDSESTKEPQTESRQPQRQSGYQEMEPVLHPSEERDTPPPETAARQYNRARIQDHIDQIREESALTHPPSSIPYPSLFHEVLVHGDRRPLPTRPNTPDINPQQTLTGEGFDQALANIAAEAQNYSMRVAELETERAEEEIQVHLMHTTGNNRDFTQIKSEVRDPRLPAKASLLRKNIYSRHEYSADKTENEQEEDSSDHSSSTNSLKRATTPPQPPLISTTAPPLRASLLKTTAKHPKPPIRRITVAKKPHGHTHAEPLEEIIIDREPLQAHEIPMADRPYKPEQDFHAGTIRSRIGRIIALDGRTLHPVTGFEEPPTPDAFIRFATVLTGDFEPYIFPEVVHNTPAGAYDLPVIRATNWGARVDEMFESRAAVLSIIGRVENAMTPSQSAELKRTLITMFISGPNGALTEATINRAYFFRALHPYYNPLMDVGQATFLRGASYYFRRIQQTVLADAIDVLLRSPQYDDFYCRKLLEIGCLDHQSGFQRQRALDYIKIYEDEILDEDGDGDDEEDGSMGSDTDYDPEQVE